MKASLLISLGSWKVFDSTVIHHRGLEWQQHLCIERQETASPFQPADLVAVIDTIHQRPTSISQYLPFIAI